jgi:hypothetical protein
MQRCCRMSRRMKRLVVDLVSCASMWGSIASAQVSAPQWSRTAPASEYVHVPGGHMVHQSCVHGINAPGAHIRIDGDDNITQDGNLIAHYDPCPYKEEGGSPNLTGWVTDEAQGYTIGGGWDEIAEYMTVPPNPSCSPSCNNTVQYYWNGVTPNTGCGGLPLLQPVLQYGVGFAQNGSIGSNYRWTMSTWYGSASGNYTWFTPFTPNAWDTILTEVIAPNPTGAGYWSVTAIDETESEPISSYEVYLTIPMPWAELAVFEAQDGGFTSCSQLPYAFGTQVVQLWGGYNGGRPISFNPSPSSCAAQSCSIPGGCVCSASLNYEESAITLYQ